MTGDTLRSSPAAADAPSLSSRLKRTTREWARNTTLHGVKHAADSDNIILRIIWTLSIVGCWSFLIWLMHVRVSTWLSSPYISIINYEYEKEGIEFPAVTICNNNKLNKTKMEKFYPDVAKIGMVRLHRFSIFRYISAINFVCGFYSRNLAIYYCVIGW
ncbi:PREDICTED: acid-sensing ion channel 5-like [Priapulus caudatus]|uniref:Acid-sensing ion channel 5-like n=1 Tax=Priapulus caudatus TaxID=37621 RepID=A0ABM1EFU4_PRICU|nr:PREDICTED: acid-sensing ion channel 5-like [Priapulus caudatus]